MAASISGTHACYPSVALDGAGNSGRCAAKNSFAPPLPASRPSSSTLRIGEQWPDLQGARDWDGLLNPLDGALRGEIVRYGEFVRAAYASFDFQGRGAPTSYGSCRFPARTLLRRSGIPETGYVVTGLLYAASNSAPSWLPSSCTCSSSYIGYVAVCVDESEIERLGRRDVVIAYRGTATCSEWVDNLHSTLTCLPTTTAPRSDDVAGEEEPMVESGFWRLFTTPGEAHGSLQHQVRGEVQKIVREYGGGKGMPPLSITVTGHSLGAALAVLTAHEIATSTAVTRDAGDAAPMVTAVSFGCPRVGNAAFRRRLEATGGKVLRVVNSNDLVTKVPGLSVDDFGSVKMWMASKIGWAYSDVGRELLLCSQDLPRNVVASHHLDLYLKLVAACTD